MLAPTENASLCSKERAQCGLRQVGWFMAFLFALILVYYSIQQITIEWRSIPHIKSNMGRNDNIESFAINIQGGRE